MKNYNGKIELVLNDKYKVTNKNISVFIDNAHSNTVILTDNRATLKPFNHEYNHNHIKGGYYKGSFDDVCIIIEIVRKKFGIRVKNNELSYVTDSKHFSEDYEKFKKAIKFIDEMLTINREEY